MGPQSLENLPQVKAEFDRCWPWLWASLCEFGPTHNKEQVWARIRAGKAFLWPEKTCAVVGEFINYPIGFRSFNYWLQGGALPELQMLHPAIEMWASTNGCHAAEGRGREGWARVMNGNWRKGPTARMKWLMQPPAHVKRQMRNDGN